MKRYQYLNNVETVILANGEFPNTPLTLSILQKASFIVCCDGAINKLGKTNFTPSAIVGDCDSLSSENKVKYKDILHINPDQETNDLTKSIIFCVSKGLKDIIILGATGKREDHTIANISLLTEYIDNVDVKIVTDYGIFIPIKEDSEFESFNGQQVSIFTINPSTQITTIGLKYPVVKREFTNWWQGTLNESVGDLFQIKTNGKIIIYMNKKGG